jgi:hypothetical protein
VIARSFRACGQLAPAAWGCLDTRPGWVSAASRRSPNPSFIILSSSARSSSSSVIVSNSPGAPTSARSIHLPLRTPFSLIAATAALSWRQRPPSHHELISGYGKRCATFRDLAREKTSARGFAVRRTLRREQLPDQTVYAFFFRRRTNCKCAYLRFYFRANRQAPARWPMAYLGRRTFAIRGWTGYAPGFVANID